MIFLNMDHLHPATAVQDEIKNFLFGLFNFALTSALLPEYNDELFVEVSVTDFLFKGISPGSVEIARLVQDLANWLGVDFHLPPVIDYEDGFAVLMGKNATAYNE